MKLENFTKDEIIAAIRTAGRIMFGDNLENLILRRCREIKLHQIQKRRDELFEAERKLLDEMAEVSRKYHGWKLVDIPKQNLDRMTAIQKEISQAEHEQKKLDKQEREVFNAMSAKQT